MNTATADGSRALYGISRDGLTIKQLGAAQPLQRARQRDVARHDRSTSCSCCFVGNLFGILVASNIGYVLANLFAIAAFVLLRRDRPNWPRPIRLPDYWIPIAAFLTGCFALFTIVGVGWFQTAGGGAVYGGTRSKIIGFCGPRRVAPPVPVPADRAGQGAPALAREDSNRARRGRHGRADRLRRTRGLAAGSVL